MIIECSPFFRENIVAGIKLEESSSWVDRHVIVEANRTHKGETKEYCFAHGSHPRVDYRKMRVDREFTTRTWHPSRRFPFLAKRSFSWVNDGLQRDYVLRDLDVDDSDIIIFSDMDEILDSRQADRIVEETRRHGLLTVGLYVNTYFLNVFDFNQIGPPDFSFRVFVMTGAFLRNMQFGIDKLRKLGESGALLDNTYRIPGYSGFHLSWIGDAEFVKDKMQAFAHEPEHFGGEAYHADGSVDLSAVEQSIRYLRHPMDPNLPLEIREDITLLDAVNRHRNTSLSSCFLAEQ